MWVTGVHGYVSRCVGILVHVWVCKWVHGCVGKWVDMSVGGVCIYVRVSG